MEYQVNASEMQQEVALSGQFTFADNQKFKDILQLLDRPATSRLTMDLANVSFVDSAALGMMLVLRDRAMQKNIELALKGAAGQVKKVFDLSRFEQLFTMVA